MSVINTFFTNKEETLFNNMGRELVEDLVGQTITAYCIDHKKNKVNIYGETDNPIKNYYTPVVFKARVNLNDKEIEWDNGKIKMGRDDIIVNIYLQHWNEIKQDYPDLEIRRGDFIKFLVDYFEVVDAGIGKATLKHHFAGDRRYFRTILAIRVSELQFNAK